MNETFELLDGLRRAKACELLGLKSIAAEIIDRDGYLIEKRDIELTALRVPSKDRIDVSSLSKWERFMNIFDLIKSGSPVTPITVTQGKSGLMLSEIPLDSLGTEEKR